MASGKRFQVLISVVLMLVVVAAIPAVVDGRGPAPLEELRDSHVRISGELVTAIVYAYFLIIFSPGLYFQVLISCGLSMFLKAF